MPSLENGATQLFLPSAGVTSSSDSQETTSIAAFLATPPAAVRDDVDRNTSLGTPSLAYVPSVHVIYNVTDRVLCRCFTRVG